MKSENYGTVICGECGTRVDIDDAEASYNEEIDDVVFYCSKCIHNPAYSSTEADNTNESMDDEFFCSEHQCSKNLVDYEDGARYECPECQREHGEALGLR
jgi:hypothetical protein